MSSLLKNGGAWESDAIIECIAGCTNPFVAENRLQGRVLAVREARYKMVLDFTSAGEKLFDLQADPGELRPIPMNEQKPVRRRLLERARQHLSDSLQSRDERQSHGGPPARPSSRMGEPCYSAQSSVATILRERVFYFGHKENASCANPR